MRKESPTPTPHSNFTLFGIEANVLRIQIRTNASQPDWVSPLTANVHGVGGRAGKSAFGGVTGGKERKTLEKWPFRGVCPQIFQLLFHFILSKKGFKVEYKFILP